MIITCPSCGASFNVKTEALGPNGRTVKCSKCAHRWHATAEDEAPEVQEAAAPAPAAADAPAMPAAEPDTEAAPAAVADAPPADDEIAPADAPTTETPAGTRDEAPDGPPDEARDEARDEAPGEIPAALPEPPPGLQEALGLTADTADDAADGEPAPGRRRRRGPKISMAKPHRSMARVLSIFVLLLVVCSAAGTAVFMKREIMMWLPATQRLYAMVGMGPEVLGHGLQIVEPTPKKEIDGNDEILVVEGEVRNIADEPVDVPLMRGALLDAHGKELHIWTFTAAKSRIGPGELVRYRTEFRNPPSEAQSLDITFTRASAAQNDATHDAEAAPKQDGDMMHESTAQQH